MFSFMERGTMLVELDSTTEEALEAVRIREEEESESFLEIDLGVVIPADLYMFLDCESRVVFMGGEAIPAVVMTLLKDGSPIRVIMPASQLPALFSRTIHHVRRFGMMNDPPSDETINKIVDRLHGLNKKMVAEKEKEVRGNSIAMESRITEIAL